MSLLENITTIYQDLQIGVSKYHTIHTFMSTCKFSLGFMAFYGNIKACFLSYLISNQNGHKSSLKFEFLLTEILFEFFRSSSRCLPLDEVPDPHNWDYASLLEFCALFWTKVHG